MGRVLASVEVPTGRWWVDSATVGDAEMIRAELLVREIGTVAGRKSLTLSGPLDGLGFDALGQVLRCVVTANGLQWEFDGTVARQKIESRIGRAGVSNTVTIRSSSQVEVRELP